MAGDSQNSPPGTPTGTPAAPEPLQVLELFGQPTTDEILGLGKPLDECFADWVGGLRGKLCMASPQLLQLCREQISMRLTDMHLDSQYVGFGHELFEFIFTHNRDCLSTETTLLEWLLSSQYLDDATAQAVSMMAPLMWQSAWVWLFENQQESCPPRSGELSTRHSSCAILPRSLTIRQYKCMCMLKYIHEGCVHFMNHVTTGRVTLRMKYAQFVSNTHQPQRMECHV